MGTNFRYRAVDAQGASHHGELEAATTAQAIEALRRRELTAVELTPAQHPATLVRARSARRASDVERAQLLHEFATLLTAGVPMGEALPSLESAYEATALAAPLALLRRSVQAGRPIAEACREAGFGWPQHTLTLLAAGEAAGRLGEAMAAAAEQLDYEQGVRQQLRTALIYPSVLVVAGALAVFIIFVAVVPRFASLIGSSRAEVPALSRWVIESGLFFRAHLAECLLVLAGLAGAVVWAARSPAIRQRVWDTLAGVPIVGAWIVSTETGRWATLLGRLLEHRVPMLQALELSARAVGLSPLRRDLTAAHGEIRRGRALSDVLAGQSWIARTRVNLLRVGERAGELPRMLARLGRLQTEAARNQMQRLLALVEPAAIVVIGVVIGVIMSGVMLAITSVNTARL